MRHAGVFIDRSLEEHLTYDDVLIYPDLSVTSRSEVVTRQYLEGVGLVEHPVIPANMDTIMGPDMKFALSVRFDSSLRLTESRAFSRADFHGNIDIEEIPSDCEKTVLLKRVKTALKSVRKCKSWNDLTKAITDVRSLIDPICRKIICHRQ